MPQPKLTPFQRALQHLAQSEGKPAPKELTPLSDPSPADMTHFVEDWPQIAPARRAQLARALVEAAEESVHVDFARVFLACLDDGAAEVRATAIDGLWENETPALARRLLKLLTEDLSSEVRAAAADGLGRFVYFAETEDARAPSVGTLAEALLSRLEDPTEDLAVRRRALESVAYSNDPRLRGVIENAYLDGEEGIRLSAVFAMGRSADQHWRQTVRDELASDSAEMRFEAVRACGELMIEAAAPTLIALIRDEDSQVALEAVWALGEIGGRAARRALEATLDDDNAALAEAAEDALAELDFLSGARMPDLLEFDSDDLAPPEPLDDEDDEDDEE